MTQFNFYDHEVVQNAPNDYVEMTVSPSLILEKWRLSMFACELLDQSGQVKSTDTMQDATLEKYIATTDAIKKGETVPKPILGIGMMDNIEIGIAREVVAIAATENLSEIPVHIRKAQADDIKKLLL